MPDLDIVDEAAAALEQLDLKLRPRDVCSRAAVDCMVDDILVPFGRQPDHRLPFCHDEGIRLRRGPEKTTLSSSRRWFRNGIARCSARRNRQMRPRIHVGYSNILPFYRMTFMMPALGDFPEEAA